MNEDPGRVRPGQDGGTMKTVLIKQDVRFLGVGYSVTGKPIPIEDDAVADELIKLGFAEEAAVDVADPGSDDDADSGRDNDDHGADHGQGGSTDDQPDPDRIHQKSLFAAPENKALQAAPENKHKEQDQ
jgi:hypothetical protein